MDYCLITLRDMSHPLEGLGFGVGMSRFSPQTPMESKSDCKCVLLWNNVLFGWGTGSCSVTIVEVLPVRIPEVSIYHYCFVNVGRVGVGGGSFEKERDSEVAWVCVSTCYITESGGRECCLACHTTGALQWG